MCIIFFFHSAIMYNLYVQLYQRLTQRSNVSINFFFKQQITSHHLNLVKKHKNSLLNRRTRRRWERKPELFEKKAFRHACTSNSDNTVISSHTTGQLYELARVRSLNQRNLRLDSIGFSSGDSFCLLSRFCCSSLVFVESTRCDLY